MNMHRFMSVAASNFYMRNYMKKLAQISLT